MPAAKCWMLLVYLLSDAPDGFNPTSGIQIGECWSHLECITERGMYEARGYVLPDGGTLCMPEPTGWQKTDARNPPRRSK